MKTRWPIEKYRAGGPTTLDKTLKAIGQNTLPGMLPELSYGPQSLPYDALPIDMRMRLIEEYGRNPDGTLSPVGVGVSPLENYLARIASDTGMIASTIVLTRGLLGRTVTVTTTPQLIINAEFLRGYIILNPNELAGATAAGTVLASAARTTTGESAALGVANYLSAHYFTDITVVPGGADTITLTLQALDPASGAWIDVQEIVSVEGTVSRHYDFVDMMGTATDARIRWEITGGSFTFSVGFVLKNGLVGTSSGIAQTIYIGGPEVTTISGFPLLNGQSEKFFLRENVQLWAVANATLPLKIFEL